MHCVGMAKDVAIRVKKEIRDLLKNKKKYKRETYSEIIKREIKAGKKELKK